MNIMNIPHIILHFLLVLKTKNLKDFNMTPDLDP